MRCSTLGLGLAAALVLVGAAALASRSLYQVPLTFRTDAGETVGLDHWMCEKVVLTMIFTSCQATCPLTMGKLREIQAQFEREKIAAHFAIVSFDPIRDTPEVLDHYAAQWGANPENWHFLTGPTADIQRVLEWFNVAAFPDEGLMDHSLHIAVIDRQGKLFANAEGNKYSTDQLADLVKTALKPAARGR